MKADIKERIEQVRRGEVPEGYRRTRAGIMPETWIKKEPFRAANIFKNHSNKNHNGNYDILSVTQNRGIIPRTEVNIDIKYDKENILGYKKVDVGDYVISLRSFQGGIEYSEREGLVSPAYTVLKSIQPINNGYYKAYFKTDDFTSRLNAAVYGIRDGKQIGYEDFGDIILHYPPISEQEKIAEILAHCDHVIELKKQLIQKKRQQKKWLIQNLLDPESGMRLADFEGEWITKVLGNVCNIYRGGSPRPIGNYITKDPEGINWIKISDTNSQGKYIYGTAEKINAEGAKYSRYVEKGDFLLSNSMSYGRPYILKTSGCIHDGWLVLKDYRESCVQDFLYYILSSPLVFKQYENKAAGSGVHNLNKDLVASVEISFPTLREQTAISRVLSTADHEIDLFEQELAQWQAKKKALMQLLLTGIVRLKGKEIS